VSNGGIPLFSQIVTLDRLNYIIWVKLIRRLSRRNILASFIYQQIFYHTPFRTLLASYSKIPLSMIAVSGALSPRG
jgi:hypothetical protein